MKKVLWALCAAAAVLFCTAALAEGWVCSRCGMRVPETLGDICPKCGAARAAPLPDVQVGDHLVYGTYPQTAQGNDQTPIEWLVLAREGNKVLLISRCALDAHCFHLHRLYPTWEKSDVRWWLNYDFINAAFTEEEQRAIVTTTVSTNAVGGNSGGADTQDRIWLLSLEEVKQYFSATEARKVVPTAYCVARGAYQCDADSGSRYMLDGVGCCWWWLRSPSGEFDRLAAAIVVYDGKFWDDYVDDVGGVRPAFWLDLEAASF